MESIAKLVEQLDSNDQVKQYQANLALTTLTTQVGAKEKSAERAKVAAELATELSATKKRKTDRGETTESKYSARTKREVARLLSLVAGAAEVPVLKKALDDLEVRSMIRWCLDRIVAPAATAALAEAASTGVGDEFRIGAINALGRRKGADVVAALKKCIQDADVEVRLAAAEALANQADSSSDAAIAAAGKSGRAKLRATKARLRLAGTLAQAGQMDAAKRVYQALLAESLPDPQKQAARRAMEQLG